MALTGLVLFQFGLGFLFCFVLCFILFLKIKALWKALRVLKLKTTHVPVFFTISMVKGTQNGEMEEKEISFPILCL